MATTRPSTAANAAAASSAAADVPPPNLEAITATTRAKYASSSDASLLKPPSFPKLEIPNVVVIISQYNSDFGENMDLVCEQRDKFESHYNDLPDWVVNLLLFNQIPHKDPVKVNFTLTPEHEKDAINPLDSVRTECCVLRGLLITLAIIWRLDLILKPLSCPVRAVFWDLRRRWPV